MKLVPAIDILDGKCVRLSQGKFEQCSVYYSHVPDAASWLTDQGFREVHVVDLDGARKGSPVNLTVLSQISAIMSVEFSGGLSDLIAVKDAFNAGASQVTIGTMAAKNPSLMLDVLNYAGNEKVILGADTKNRKIVVKGWQEESASDVFEFIGFWIGQGIKTVMCTDVTVDGMLCGPSVQLYKEILEKYPGIRLRASGGIKGNEDVEQLESAGVHSVIVGKALYSGLLDVQKLKKFM